MVQVDFVNHLRPGVTGKDVIVTLCSLFNQDQVLNCAVEFTGSISKLGIDHRLTIANMTTEWGALAGLFPVDQVTVDWLELQAKKLSALYPKGHPRLNRQAIDQLKKNIIIADADAAYAKKITLDLATVGPYCSGPNSVKIAQPVAKLAAEKIAIQKAYLVSCTNSRASDLAEAANTIKGRKIAPGVEFYVAAASLQVQRESETAGHWQTLIDAGAKVLPAGCGPCIGLGVGLLKEGEVGISATNRNYKGRMGHKDAKAYLASPAVVAESAVTGYISNPSGLGAAPVGTFTVSRDGASDSTDAAQTSENAEKDSVDSIVGNAGDVINGNILFCDMDNLNTDIIYPGKYTYQDLNPSEMARVAMENYNKEFSSFAQKGDILVSGFNFGTGSSREQAATCLLYLGVKVVIVGSCSQTFKRNAINNGLLVLEQPQLVSMLRAEAKGKSMQRMGEIKIDLERSKVAYRGRVFGIASIGDLKSRLAIHSV